MIDRAAHVRALRAERDAVLQAGGDPARLQAIDDQLDRFADEPKNPPIERAVPRSPRRPT